MSSTMSTTKPSKPNSPQNRSRSPTATVAGRADVDFERLLSEARRNIRHAEDPASEVGDGTRGADTAGINYDHWEPLILGHVFPDVEASVDDLVAHGDVTKKNVFHWLIRHGAAHAIASHLRRDISKMRPDEVTRRILSLRRDDQRLSNFLKERMPWGALVPRLRGVLWSEELHPKLRHTATALDGAAPPPAKEALAEQISIVVRAAEVKGPVETVMLDAISDLCTTAPYHPELCYLALPVVAVGLVPGHTTWKQPETALVIVTALREVWGYTSKEAWESNLSDLAHRTRLLLAERCSTPATGRELEATTKHWLRVGFVGIVRFPIAQYLWDQVLVWGTLRLPELCALVWRIVIPDGPLEKRAVSLDAVAGALIAIEVRAFVRSCTSTMPCIKLR
eukprot:PhM_4_TR5053/c0_g1_i1/m.44301